MSDSNSGDESLNRPGVNAEFVGADGGESSAGPRKKRSRWRGKRRPGRSDTGIPAENSSTGAPKTGEPKAVAAGSNSVARPADRPTNSYVEANQQRAADGEQQPLGASKSSKRRRRRRRRRNRGREQEQAAVSGTPNEVPVSATAEGQAEAKIHRDPSDHSRDEKRRRGGRRRNRRPSIADDRRTDQAAKGKPATYVADEKRIGSSGKSPRGQSNPRDRRPARHWGDAYAALDLGTNNCRLLVAVPQQPGRFKVVDAFSRIVRLGEGLAATGELREEAMQRAIGALKLCAGKLNNRRVKGVRLIATEACRSASNGEEFLQRVEQQTGIKLEIIDRETEARLAVAGCSTLVDRRAKGVVLFDIGGGSSELALLDLDKRNRHDLAPAMVSWTSLPLGVVTLSEKHGGGRVVTRPIFENMVDDVSKLLLKFEGREALQSVSERGEVHLLGTSGTVTTLAGIHLNLPRYDRRRVDGIWMSSDDVDAMINRLVDMTFEERAANPCIGYDRADLVLAGCAILVAIQRLWPCPRLRVADRGLREGLLTEMMNADNAWQRRTRYYRHNRN